MTQVRLDKLLSNLGYGSRKDITRWAKEGRITDKTGQAMLRAADKVDPTDVRLDAEPLDPFEVLILMHKPAGLTCSHRNQQGLVYDLLPPRYRRRDPGVSSVGRLDRDTTGVLLLTDNGQLLHRLIAPSWKQPKTYEVTTSLPIKSEQVEALNQGGWCLPDDEKPLAPAQARKTGEHHLTLVLTEGRHHQVKRMLEAVGNPLTALHRSSFAGLTLGTLQAGEWRNLSPDEKTVLFKSCNLSETFLPTTP